MRFKLLILVCVAIFATTFIVSKLTAETEIPSSVVVTQTNTGFSPQEVLIKKGGSVTFRNASDKPFWPASDSHPDHTRYPEFDPKKPILPGEEWVFIFDQAGPWRYHDHLAHEVRGKVLVEGEQSEIIKPCLERTADLVVRAECWEVEVVKIIKTKGLGPAFEAVRGFYKTNPEFRDNCHYVMHAFGNAAYPLYEKGKVGVINEPEISWCNYGFYHGFIESMSLTKGKGNYGDIFQYCEKLGGSEFLTGYLAYAARVECIHPIGYSILGSLDESLWGDGEQMVVSGLRICEDIFNNDTDRRWCSSGIFASLAAAYTNQFYNLSTLHKDPSSLCSKQKLYYQAVCYRYLPVVYIREKNMDFNDTFLYLRSLPGNSAIYWGIAGFIHDEIARPRLKIIPSDWPMVCEKMFNGNEKEACVSSVISGLSSRSEPEYEYKSMGSFCNLISPSLKESCFQKMFDRIRRMYATEKVDAVCKEYLPENIARCVWK